jgi:GNAT superfamily N-acetyltransferase
LSRTPVVASARFEEIYEEAGVQQLLFEVDGEIVAYAECTYEVTGSDNWINPRYFEKRDMRPMFIDELAVHPDWNGRGVGSFVLEQLHHLAGVNGLTPGMLHAFLFDHPKQLLSPAKERVNQRDEQHGAQKVFYEPHLC